MSSEAGERGRGQHLEGLACHALMMQNHRKVLDKGAVRSDLNFMKIILARKGVLIGGGKLRSETPARRLLWRSEMKNSQRPQVGCWYLALIGKRM